ncbi:MAG: MerR family transcriptional regulator [Cyclobacteriaceae bacterium]|nr:MerR family transcriptional regulator [Cyclobacteriaceae bacterium]
MSSSIKLSFDKEYYNITEAAKMFKVASSLIRFWESEFDILQPGKDEKGNRRYTKKDLENLRIVYHLVKEKGYTLKGAKNILEEKHDSVQQDISIINSLHKVKSLLIELREKIQ